MILKDLIDAAFQYKRTKLWQKITDTDIFAVKLSNEEIGYVCIMGMAGRHCALAVYVGQAGFDSYITLLSAQNEDVLNTLAPLQRQEYFMRQDCLQCILVDPSELSREEYREIQIYWKQNKIRQDKNEICPQFKRYQPRHIPWHLQSEQEEQILCEVLMAAVEMAKILEKKSVSEVGFVDVRNNVSQIPMLDLVKGKYILKKTPMPKRLPVVYPAPIPSNDISVAKMRKGKRRGVWECEVIQFPMPVQDEEGVAPVFPVGILAVENVTGYLLSIPPVLDFEDHADELLEWFMEAFFAEKLCPKAFKVRDERTRCFVAALCERLNISLQIEQNLPALDDAQESMMEHFSAKEEQSGDAMDLLNEILNFSDEDLAAMPEDFIQQLEDMVKYGEMPDKLSSDVNKILQFAKARRREGVKEIKKTGQKQDKTKIVSLVPAKPEVLPEQEQTESAYVISVAYETGCYRHIQISADSTLYDLHKAILTAYAFQDNRAHVFFMDNIVWSDQDAYFADGMEDVSRKTMKCPLNKLNLGIGSKFKYLFDFGEEWIFQCKVLRIVEERTDEPVVLKSKGEAPDRYGDWDL